MTQSSEDKIFLPNFTNQYKEKQNKILEFSSCINTDYSKILQQVQNVDAMYLEKHTSNKNIIKNVPKGTLNIDGKRFCYIYTNHSGKTLLRLQKFRVCPSCLINIEKNFNKNKIIFFGNDKCKFLLSKESFKQIDAYMFSKYVKVKPTRYNSITRECIIVYLKTILYRVKEPRKLYEKLENVDYFVKFCNKTNSIKIKYYLLNKVQLETLGGIILKNII